MAAEPCFPKTQDGGANLSCRRKKSKQQKDDTLSQTEPRNTSLLMIMGEIGRCNWGEAVPQTTTYVDTALHESSERNSLDAVLVSCDTPTRPHPQTLLYPSTQLIMSAHGFPAYIKMTQCSVSMLLT